MPGVKEYGALLGRDEFVEPGVQGCDFVFWNEARQVEVFTTRRRPHRRGRLPRRRGRLP